MGCRCLISIIIFCTKIKVSFCHRKIVSYYGGLRTSVICIRIQYRLLYFPASLEWHSVDAITVFESFFRVVCHFCAYSLCTVDRYIVVQTKSTDFFFTTSFFQDEILYGCSAGKLNELFCVRKEAFFNKRAEDSDICKSFITDLGGALVRALLMSGVIPLIIR